MVLLKISTKTALPSLAKHYIEKGGEELGAANIVTSVVVTYRGLDTLGEVTILFVASAVVSLLIKLAKNDDQKTRKASELLS